MTSRVGWLTARAWLDVDGRHVWVAHDCVDGRITTMLPWPVWQSSGLTVSPSVSCEACGLHAFVPLGAPDEEYQCSVTFVHDGRRCESMVGHGELHSAGLMSWGEYKR